jgi:ferric-dicitrate binding protein FerR (iron transport regulator)
MTKRKDYKRFLDDMLFIEWRLTQSDELEAHWQQYMADNPEDKKAIDVAIEKCKSIRLNDRELSEYQIRKLWERIETSIEKDIESERKKRKTTIIAILSAAASIAILVVSGLLIQSKEEILSEDSLSEIIVGEQLPDKSIQLFSGNKAVSFDSNTHIIVDENNNILIEGDEDKKEIVSASGEINRLFVPYGRRSTLTLSDGTRVWINSGTELEFPSKFAHNERRITVRGEIYVEVAENRSAPFWVQTAEFDVKVHGTKFNVFAYKNAPEKSVVLVAGKVEVAVSDMESVFLSPNDKLVVSSSGVSTSVVNPAEFISWKDNILLLNNVSIADILRRIGRYYNVSFDISESTQLSKRTATGRLFLSENIDDIMKSLSVLSSTTYTRKGNTIYITDKN